MVLEEKAAVVEGRVVLGWCFSVFDILGVVRFWCFLFLGHGGCIQGYL